MIFLLWQLTFIASRTNNRNFSETTITLFFGNHLWCAYTMVCILEVSLFLVMFLIFQFTESQKLSDALMTLWRLKFNWQKQGHMYLYINFGSVVLWWARVRTAHRGFSWKISDKNNSYLANFSKLIMIS